MYCFIVAPPETPASVRIRTCANKDDGDPCQVCEEKTLWCMGYCYRKVCDGDKDGLEIEETTKRQETTKRKEITKRQGPTKKHEMKERLS